LVLNILCVINLSCLATKMQYASNKVNGVIAPSYTSLP